MQDPVICICFLHTSSQGQCASQGTKLSFGTLYAELVPCLNKLCGELAVAQALEQIML